LKSRSTEHSSLENSAISKSIVRSLCHPDEGRI
jgi:hypothetical protein